MGQATRLSYRWNTCSSSTINSHLSAQGLWGILTELQGGSRPSSYQLADLALTYAVAWQRSSYTDKDKKITDHVADVGGVWLFILHSYGAAVTEEELNHREALWVSMLRTDDSQRGLNQPGRTKVVDAAASLSGSPSRETTATIIVID